MKRDSREAMDDSISEATEDNHQRRRRLATFRERRQLSKNNDDDSIRHRRDSEHLEDGKMNLQNAL